MGLINVAKMPMINLSNCCNKHWHGNYVGERSRFSKLVQVIDFVTIGDELTMKVKYGINSYL
jgi:hypothetical protein